MHPRSLKYLEDVYRYAKDALDMAHGRTFAEYATDKQLRYAIERCFEIVGEALSQINKIDPHTAQRITDWRQIIGFRNVLIHGYSAVSDEKTWSVLTDELPVLLVESRTLFLEGGGVADDLTPDQQ